MLLDSLAVVLVKTRFPENIGMVARACANMGCPEIRLVDPERWDPLKAEPLATASAVKLLANIRIYADLPAALAPFAGAYATTARLGGWRRCVMPAQAAAAEIAAGCKSGAKFALVFGPEDRGMTNNELACCQKIVSIPAEAGASSLNLAQAALILLYECRKAFLRKNEQPPQERTFISCADLSRLEENLKQALLALDCFGEENQDYFFQQWRILLNRAQLRRHEYDALMGLCRQIMNRAQKTGI